MTTVLLMFNLIIALASDFFSLNRQNICFLLLFFLHFAQSFVLLNVLYRHLNYFPKFCLIHFVYYLKLIILYHVTLNHLSYLILFLVAQSLCFVLFHF